MVGVVKGRQTQKERHQTRVKVGKSRHKRSIAPRKMSEEGRGGRVMVAVRTTITRDQLDARQRTSPRYKREKKKRI